MTTTNEDRLAYRARFFRQEAASARAYRDDQQTALDLEADADAIDAILADSKERKDLVKSMTHALADERDRTIALTKVLSDMLNALVGLTVAGRPICSLDSKLASAAKKARTLLAS